MFAAAAEATVLVNSAGTNVPGPAAEYDIADFDRVFEVNVRNVLHLPGVRRRAARASTRSKG